MNARILRGANEVGGSCVELESGGRRLVVDVGLPLGDGVPYRDLLPEVPGLWAAGDGSLEGVVLSHLHGDHCGLADLVTPEVPVLAGAASVAILEAAALYRPGAATPAEGVLRDGVPVQLGPFIVTPLRLGHSAHESFALLVEAGGARLLYSGDLRIATAEDRRRAHRVAEAARGVDVLLLEGTSIGRAVSGTRSEDDVTARYIELLRVAPGLVLAMLSPMNTDRLAAVYAACREAGRKLVIDLYTADVLATLECDPALPQVGAPGVRVYLPWTQRRRIVAASAFERVDRVRRHRIYEDELHARRAELTMIARTSMLPELRAMRLLGDAEVAWSMWAGYLRGETASALRREGLVARLIHASGHASPEGLLEFADAVGPARVVPVHTDRPEELSAMLQRTGLHKDGEWWRVGR